MRQEDLEVKKSILKGLEKKLICYGCKQNVLTIFNRKAYRCQRMHLLCEDCDRMTPIYHMNIWLSCPCGGSWENTICPKFSEYPKDWPYFCEYHNNGCREILFEEEMRQHQEQCNYKEANCISCWKKIMYKDYANHLEKECSKREFTIRSKDNTCIVSVKELTRDHDYYPMKVDHNCRPFYSMHRGKRYVVRVGKNP